PVRGRAAVRAPFVVALRTVAGMTALPPPQAAEQELGSHSVNSTHSAVGIAAPPGDLGRWPAARPGSSSRGDRYDCVRTPGSPHPDRRLRSPAGGGRDSGMAGETGDAGVEEQDRSAAAVR